MKAKRQAPTGFDPALWAWEQNERTTGTTKWVLVTLCKYADADGSNCYPSLARLAADTNLVERTVRLALRSLEDAGYIAVEHRGHVLTSMYRLPLYEQYLRRRGEADAPPNRSNEGNDVPLIEGNEMPPSMPDEGHMTTVRGEYKGRQGGTTCPLPSNTFQRPSKEIGATSPASVAEQQPKSIQRRSRIEPNWQPDAAGEDRARQAGIVDVPREIERFRDHHLAKGSVMADWGAAWRTWCGRAQGFAGGKSSSPAGQPAGGLSTTDRMPSLSDPKEAWYWLADRNDDGTARIETGVRSAETLAFFTKRGQEPKPLNPEDIGAAVVGGYYFPGLAQDVAHAAGIYDPDWRPDWRPLCTWLREGIRSNTVLDAIRRVATRSNYSPPRSLMYFDSAVREAATRQSKY